MRLREAEPDYYAVLQVAPTASPGVVRAAYLALVRQYHPDVAPAGRLEESLRRTQELNAAKAVLLDPDARADYDWRRGEEQFETDPVPDSEPPSQEPQVSVVVESPACEEPVRCPREPRFAVRVSRYAGWGLLAWWGTWLLAWASYQVLAALLG